MKTEIMTEKILKILDNVRYWETCSDDYKDTIEQFLANNSQPIKLMQTAVVGQSEQLVLFAEWLQYNGKYQLPEEQVKTFLKQQ